ncbi:MAG: prolipoprotein diacylglyceryl transferase [Candidatus Buchananbacteria bacterium]|nr:prolipoprotein diacylglyceryl transferase [Candidatus Buchananbacteria bacterium]
MINFLHQFSPSSILVQIGPLSIHWYGLFIVLGIVAGLITVLKAAKYLKISTDEVYNLVFYLIIFSLIGARIYDIFLEWPYFISHPSEIIAVWHGGLAIHGAIIGGIATLLVYVWKKKQSFWRWADLLILGLPIGQALGRWGNYFNQELFGWPTSLPWGIYIKPENRPAEFASSNYFQPAFLYESILNFLNFLVLIFLFSKKAKWKIKEGSLALIYLINYSVIRIIMEFVRIDRTPVVFGWRIPILVSLVVIGLAGSLFFYRYKKIDSKSNSEL